MIITMVIDQYGQENNGTTISTRRFATALRKRGHTVRIVAAGTDNLNEEDVYSVPIRNIPIASWFAKKQGMLFARPDKETLRKAIKGSDIVHVLMPFAIERAAIKVAREMNIPVTGAFHVQAENVTSQIGMGSVDLANKTVYKLFKSAFYKKLKHIHCPSAMIADELRRNGYEATLHVVTNGADDEFKMIDVQKPEEYTDKFVILSIGRLSPEKRHDILIDAVKLSKYADKIQVIIAGKGPLAEQLREYSADMKVQPVFDFFTKQKLIETINYSDLYVHPADIEIEAISCVEAFKCGIVPVISNNPKCATKQFALTDKNLFKYGDPKSLAKQIDYWIEHEEEKKDLSLKYIEYGKEFAVDKAIVKIEQMFEQAIREHKEKIKY